MSEEAKKRGPEPYRTAELLEWLSANMNDGNEVEVPSIRALSKQTGIPSASLEWSVKRLQEEGKLRVERPDHWRSGPVRLEVVP